MLSAVFHKILSRLCGCVRKICGGIWKTKFDWLSISIITFIISTIWAPHFPDPKNIFGDDDEDNLISLDYLHAIRGESELPTESGYITIVDIGDVTSRRQIAEILDYVYSLNPRCIGVDLDFSAGQEGFTDSILSATISRIKEKAVFVNQLYEYDNASNAFTKIHNSYFSTGRSNRFAVDHLNEGFANLKNNGTSESVLKYSVAERFNDSIYLSLPARMIDDESIVDLQEHYISYYPTLFNVVRHDEITHSDIAENFVLVGAVEHSGDKYNTPLGLMPGIMIHAYIIQTIVEGSEIKVMPELLDICLTLFTGVAFIIFLVALDYFIRYTKHRTASLIIQTGFLTFGITYLAALALGLFSYYLFTEYNIYASMHGILNSILVVASIVKVSYSTVIIVARKFGLLQRLLSFSFYN